MRSRCAAHWPASTSTRSTLEPAPLPVSPSPILPLFASPPPSASPADGNSRTSSPASLPAHSIHDATVRFLRTLSPAARFLPLSSSSASRHLSSFRSAAQHGLVRRLLYINQFLQRW